jgi:hypothetical protein
MRFSFPSRRNALRRFFFFLAAVSLIAVPLRHLISQSHLRKAAAQYLWPTNASRSLSSSFAETRTGHFHFGIDIRTQQRTGFPCYAVADGYVARIKVSPYGYGRVLYLQLQDGNMAVYAHLQKFAPAVEKVVHAEQMRTKQFRCEMFFQPDELPFKSGEIVAYTGDSGVGSPHLHFEIRDGEGYCNPFLYGFTVADSLAPIPEKIAFFPLDGNSEINDGFHPQIWRPTPDGANRYRVQPAPALFGRIGLGISAYDRINDSSNQLGLYALDLFLDDSLTFSARYDAFDFYKEKQIDLERNYRLRRKTGEAFNHLFKDPAISVNFYRAGDGILDSRNLAPGFHEYEIVVADFAGNAARIRGRFEIKASSLYPPLTGYTRIFGFFGHRQDPARISRPTASAGSSPTAEFFDDYVVFTLPTGNAGVQTHLSLLEPYRCDIPLIPLNGRLVAKLLLQPFPPGYWTVETRRESAAGFSSADTVAWYLQPIKPSGGTALAEDGNFIAEFDRDAVYRTMYARVIPERSPADGTFLSPVYRLEPDDVPIRGSVRIAIRIPETETQPEKLGVYKITHHGTWAFVDNNLSEKNGFVTGSSPRLESYALRKDTAPPAITWISPPAATSQRQPTFRMSVRDDLSGLDDRTVYLEVDGKFVLMEYDSEARTIHGTADEPLAPGEHRIKLTLSDFCGNRAELHRTLRITPS